MNEHIVLCGIICLTVIVLYTLSIAKSMAEKKRLEVELELLRKSGGVRPPHKSLN